MAVDPFFPEPPSRRCVSMETMAENRFEMVFHEVVDGGKLRERLGSRLELLAVEDPNAREEEEGRGEEGC